MEKASVDRITKWRGGALATEQDIGIMREALEIIKSQRPQIMNYLKEYDVTFVDLTSRNPGRVTAKPTLTLRDPANPTIEISFMVLTVLGDAPPEEACFALPLSSADRIAAWIIRQFDADIRRRVMAAERNLSALKRLAGKNPSTECDGKYPPIAPQTLVVTTQANIDAPEGWMRLGWVNDPWNQRRWGAQGMVLTHFDTYGLYYEVQHNDETVGYYKPSELKVV